MIKESRKTAIFVYLPTLFLAAIFFAIGYYIDSTDHKDKALRLERETEVAAADLNAQLLISTIAVESIESFYLQSADITEDEFQTFIGYLSKSIPGAITLAWLDETDIIRHINPTTGENLSMTGTDINSLPGHRDALQRAKMIRHPAISRPVHLPQGFPGVAIFDPVFIDGRHIGTAMVVISLESLLDDAKRTLDYAELSGALIVDDRFVPLDGSAIFTQEGKKMIGPLDETEPDDSSHDMIRAAAAATSLGRMEKADGWILAVYRPQAGPDTFLVIWTVMSLAFLLMTLYYLIWLQVKHTALQQVIVRERDFVSLVSHQLRIPLTELSWMIETVFETGTGSMTEEQMTTVQDIRGIVRNSIKLISDLLNVSRLERGVIKVTCEEVHLLQLANEAIKPLARQAGEMGVKFVVTVPENMVVFADQQKAIEAIRNILDNAVKYATKENHLIEIGASETDGFRTLTIRDHGKGIAKDIQSTLFEKSSAFAKKGEDTGSGLGLYLAKHFIERMGGDITFTSSPEGTTFLLSFTTDQTGCRDEDEAK